MKPQHNKRTVYMSVTSNTAVFSDSGILRITNLALTFSMKHIETLSICVCLSVCSIHVVVITFSSAQENLLPNSIEYVNNAKSIKNSRVFNGTALSVMLQANDVI